MQVSAQTEKKQQLIYSKWQSAINVKNELFFLASTSLTLCNLLCQVSSTFCVGEKTIEHVGVLSIETELCRSSRLNIVTNHTIRCWRCGALFSVCISQLYRPQKHIDMRTKGKGEITAVLFAQKAKKADFSAALFKKRLHPPHAISHCSLLISLKSYYRLKVRNFHSASAEQFRSSWMSQMSLKRTDLFILLKVVKMSVGVPVQSNNI